MKSCHCVVFGDKMSQPYLLLRFWYSNNVSQDKLKVRRESGPIEAEVNKKKFPSIKKPKILPSLSVQELYGIPG